MVFYYKDAEFKTIEYLNRKKDLSKSRYLAHLKFNI